MKKGDLVWDARQPGGVCVILGVIPKATPVSKQKAWRPTDYPIFKVHHPTEGIIEEPSYYYEQLDAVRYWIDGTER